MAVNGWGSRLKTALESAATLAMLAASVTIIWASLRPRTTAADTAPREPAYVPYSIGEPMSEIAEVNWAEAPSTLVVYVRSTCRFCTESMEFYRRLSERPRKSRIIVLGAEPESTIQAYLQNHRFRPDRVVSIKSSQLKFRGTPSLALVGQNARVRGVWVGQLDRNKESEVLRAVQ